MDTCSKNLFYYFFLRPSMGNPVYLQTHCYTEFQWYFVKIGGNA